MDQVTAYPDSASSSPRSRSDSFDDPLYPSSQSSKLRLMCSYGGRIVPRPTDKSLCYLGGDTRILLLDRNSSLHDLLSKLVSLLNLTNFTLKYQLPNEDLDSLISLSSDEDLENMVDEYDRIANSGKSSSSRIRLFVFSGNMESSANSRGSIGSLLDDSKSETWFVDALNGTGIGVDGSSNLIGFDDGKVLDRDSSFGSTNSGLNLPPIRVRVSEDHRLSEKINLEEQFKKMNVYGSDDGRSDMRKQQTVLQQGINQQQQKFPPVDAPISDPRLVYYEERMPQPSIPMTLEPNREIPVSDPPIPYRNQHITIPVPATIPGSGYTLPTIPVQQPSQPQTQQQFVPINPQTIPPPQHSQPQSQPQFIPANPQAQNQQQQFMPTNPQPIPPQQQSQPQTQQQFVPVNPQTFSAPQSQQQQQFIPANPQAIPQQQQQPQPQPQIQDGQFIAGNPQSIPTQQSQPQPQQQFEPTNPQTIPVNPQAQPQQQQFIPTNPQTQQQQHQFIPASSQMIPPTQQSHPQSQQQQQQHQQQFIPANPQTTCQPQNQQQQFMPANPQTISQPQNQQQQFMPTNPQTQQSQPQNQQQQFIPANSQYVPMQSYYQLPIQQSHQGGQSHYVPQSQPFDPNMPMYYVPVRQNQQPVSAKGGAPKSELQQPNMYRNVAPPSQMVHGGAPGSAEQGHGQYAGMRYHVLHHPGQVQGNNASAVYYTQAQTMPNQYQNVMSDAGQQGQQTMEMKQNRGN